MKLTSVLLVIFLVLKLTGNISWSWWWVLSPFWIPCLVLAVLFVFLVVLKRREGIAIFREAVQRGRLR